MLTYDRKVYAIRQVRGYMAEYDLLPGANKIPADLFGLSGAPIRGKVFEP